jgi:putative transposase
MRKRHSAAFKAQVVQEMLKEDKTLAQLAAKHGVHPNQLRQWRATFLEGLPTLFAPGQQAAEVAADYEAKLTALYAEIGRLTTQVAWLKKKSGLEPDTP